MNKSVLLPVLLLCACGPDRTTVEHHESLIVAEKDFLLLPSSDDGPVSSLEITVGGRNILGAAQDVIIAENDVDYYIPIDISGLRGDTLSVRLTDVSPRDKTVTGMRLSDTRNPDLNEKYRQVFHFTPEFGWTNDPNGMVYLDGEYHLAYQANPYGTKHYNMHWGNAVSKDLVHWQDLPFIIAPDSLGAIYSGSSVVDFCNSAGFGENAIVAMYTSASETQKQSIAYSTDGGRTYTKYEGNPVLSEPDIIDFRDPKVFRYGDKWIAAIAAADVISFYESTDLKAWTKLSDFGEGQGCHDGVWECPDLLPMEYDGQRKWVLIVNINPGGPNGGSSTQYFIGDFDGKTFTADPLPYPLWLDGGMDNYAGVTFSNTGRRHILLGWMSNWLYANEVPTQNFRNSMTIARDLKLKSNGDHIFLANYPSPEIYAARGEARRIDVTMEGGTATIPQILPDSNGAYEIDFTVTPGKDRRLALRLFNERKENVTFNFDFEAQAVSLDRSNSGITSFSEDFAGRDIVGAMVRRDIYHIKLFVDRHSTELFINDGDCSFTNTVFPSEPYCGIEFISEEAKVSDCTVYEIR